MRLKVASQVDVEQVRRLLAKTVQRIHRKRKNIAYAAGDSSGFDAHHASRYFIWRRDNRKEDEKRPKKRHSYKHYGKLMVIICCLSHAIVAAVATGAGFTAFAWGHGFGGPWRHGGFMHGHADPAQMEAHLDRMLQHAYIEIGATDAQKQQLEPIVKAAARDLHALRGRMRDDHKQAVTLLTSDRIDRAALEGLRTQHTQVHDELSKRVTQALADIADDPLVLDETLEPLYRYSLVRRDVASRSYSILPIMQAVLLDGMTPDESTSA